MDKLKRKQYMFGVLKTLAYFVGFPLLLIAVLIGSNQFMHYDIFNSTWYMSLIIVAIPWLLATILQITFGCFVKSQNVKTIVVALVVVIVMVGSALTIDIYGNSRIGKVQEQYSESKYVDAGVVVNDYKYQVNWYVTKTNEKGLLDQFKVRLDDFTKVYHLEQNGYSWADKNISDGHKVDSKNKDVTTVTVNTTEGGLGLTNCNVSANGLLAEGWIFSAQNALDILITYHEIYNKALSLGIDLEASYKDIIEQTKNSVAYQSYMTTNEYLSAYGTDGYANKYMITEDKLNGMIPTLADYLATAIYDISKIVPGFSEGFIGGILDISAMRELKTVDELLDYVNGALVNAADSVGSFVKDGPNPLIDQETGLPMSITKSFVLDLVEELTYYYAPTVRPVFDFIAEATDSEYNRLFDVVVDSEIVLTAEEVQQFAYARYYAKIHGANIGSVLIGDKIGAVTMNTSGYPAENFAWTLEQLYQLDADLSYIPSFYPYLVARRFLYVFAGICALSIILFYQFGKREDDIINEIIISKGGSK